MNKSSTALVKPLLPWQQNIASLAIMYAIKEQGKIVSTLLQGDDTFLEPVLDLMSLKGLLDIGPSNTYVVTKEGEALRGKMVAMYDQLLKFELFGAINTTLDLTDDNSSVAEDGSRVLYDDQLDPRYIESPESVDLRLAMLDWFSQSAESKLDGKAVDPYQVVFMQRLRAGYYKGDDFWFKLRLGLIYTEVQQIVETATKWQDLGANVTESSNVMNAIYTAGMSEQIKRDGDRCECGAYLGMFDYYAHKEGKTLDVCPACDKSYTAPIRAEAEYCPNCNSDIQPRWRKCHGCGAKIDRSMAAGSVEEVTTSTTYTETVYVPGAYGYDPYYSPWGGSYMDYGYYPPAPLYAGIWYDPFDPIASVATFALCCALL